MTVQNGLGCEHRGRPRPVADPVLRHLHERYPAFRQSRGYELDTATWLGPWAGGSASDDALQVADLINRSGLKAGAFADVQPAQWSKRFSIHPSTVSARSRTCRTSSVAERTGLADLGHLVHAMMEEGKSVAAALGIELYEDPWAMNVEAVSRWQHR